MLLPVAAERRCEVGTNTVNLNTVDNTGTSSKMPVAQRIRRAFNAL